VKLLLACVLSDFFFLIFVLGALGVQSKIEVLFIIKNKYIMGFNKMNYT